MVSLAYSASSEAIYGEAISGTGSWGVAEARLPPALLPPAPSEYIIRLALLGLVSPQPLYVVHGFSIVVARGR
eukprot:8031142-Heterocapsa_arctica.AAC.1